ncbi:MAG: hypothetical protein ACUVRQ_07205 [Thermoanaerobaculaceae bacterium]
MGARGHGAKLVILAVTAGLGAGGCAGLCFWAHPFNLTLWHRALGLGFLGICAWAAAMLLFGKGKWLSKAVALGLEEEEAFLARTVRCYSACRFLDARWSADAKVVTVGCYSRLYTHTRLYSPMWEPNELAELRSKNLRKQELAQALSQRGFVAMIVNRRDIPKSWLGSPFLEDAFLTNHAKLVFEDKGVEVYELIGAPTAN